jgi:hypothetical protein
VAERRKFGVPNFTLGSTLVESFWPFVWKERGMGETSINLATENDYEVMFRAHILRHWTRERIDKFALHLLGDECQECRAKLADGQNPSTNRSCAAIGRG